MAFSVGNKLHIGVGGRKDSFEDKSEVDYIAKVILKEVLDDALMTLESSVKL